MNFIIWGDIILGIINYAKFKNDIGNTISFWSNFCGFTLNLTKFGILETFTQFLKNFIEKLMW